MKAENRLQLIMNVHQSMHGVADQLLPTREDVEDECAENYKGIHPLSDEVDEQEWQEELIYGTSNFI
jgi:hypothetical protein